MKKLPGTRKQNVGPLERVWSVAGGVALLAYGLKRGSLAGAGMAALGGAFALRGIGGYSLINEGIDRDTAHNEGVSVGVGLTVRKPRSEVYAFWRRFENFPHFMKHVSEVKEIDGRTYWEAPIPEVGEVLEWQAEVEADEPNHRIVWRSLDGSDVENSGEVIFADAPGDRGTEVRVRIAYRPPAGIAGAAAAKLLNPVFEQMVKEDIRRFKHVIETGETPSIHGQPAGR